MKQIIKHDKRHSLLTPARFTYTVHPFLFCCFLSWYKTLSRKKHDNLCRLLPLFSFIFIRNRRAGNDVNLNTWKYVFVRTIENSLMLFSINNCNARLYLYPVTDVHMSKFIEGWPKHMFCISVCWSFI